MWLTNQIHRRRQLDHRSALIDEVDARSSQRCRVVRKRQLRRRRESCDRGSTCRIGSIKVIDRVDELDPRWRRRGGGRDRHVHLRRQTVGGEGERRGRVRAGDRAAVGCRDERRRGRKPARGVGGRIGWCRRSGGRCRRSALRRSRGRARSGDDDAAGAGSGRRSGCGGRSDCRLRRRSHRRSWNLRCPRGDGWCNGLRSRSSSQCFGRARGRRRRRRRRRDRARRRQLLPKERSGRRPSVGW